MSAMGKVDMPAAGLKKPMQFGPMILTPPFRAESAMARSMFFPSGPSSPKPAAKTTTPLSFLSADSFLSDRPAPAPA
jgi:hypothetical protein